MAYRQTIFATGEVYHVFNRGVEGSEIFKDKRDYKRFLQTFVYYQKQNPPTRFSFRQRSHLLTKEFSKLKNLVEIVCYCLMPTHFHFLLKQNIKQGISLFLSRVSNSYTRYFNIRHRREGRLFQAPFKGVRIENDEQLVHVSRYIHLNPLIDFVVKDLREYPFSSYWEYLGLEEKKICQSELVLSHFSSSRKYEKFVLDQLDYARKLKKIERILIE